MHARLERLLSKSLTTLEVMAYYLVVHTGPERKGWASKYGGQAVTHAADHPPPPPTPLSTSLEWSIAMASADTHGYSDVAGVTKTLLYAASDCLRDTGSEFFLRVNSRSLSYELVWSQGSGGFKSEFSIY